MITVLLVDDDPLQAHVRKMILGRHFPAVERAADAAEAFILVEDSAFAENLGLVVVGLNRPGLGSPAFVAELTARLPRVPVLVLGQGRDDDAFYEGSNVRFLSRSVSPEQMVTACRRMLLHTNARVA